MMMKRIALAIPMLMAWVAIGPVGSTQPSGSWEVDNGHSDARLSVDGTTNFGKTPTTFTIGFTRAIGTVRLDKDDPTKSVIDFKLYPAGSMRPVIDEDGKVKRSWLISMANHTLICFNSQSVTAVGDDKLKATGILTLTRVDHNVELTPNEAYSGPVYGPPIIHRISREATFLFRIPATGAGKGEVSFSGSAGVNREDFPQLVSSVLSTYWPPVVQDKKCEMPSGTGDEGYDGAKCTGTLIGEGSSVPEAPSGVNGREDYPGPSNFNSVVGQHLDLQVHLRLTQADSRVAQKTGE
jgi:polyisoprenoid-binding protein YceI